MMDNIEDVMMPFGKYVGEYVCDLPIGYLEWIYENVELKGDLAEAVTRAIDDHYNE